MWTFIQEQILGIDGDVLVLTLTRTGTHSELFGK